MVKKITSLCVLLVTALSGFATNYYSSPSGGNFTDPIWSTDSVGPFNVSGTTILYSDNLVVQGRVTLDYSIDSLYAKNLTIKKGATVTTIHGATFYGDIIIEKGGILFLGPTGGSTGFVSAKDIYIKSGGKIWGNDPVNASATNIKTIRIWGSILECNGTIGDGANNDALMIEAEGSNVTISGKGQIDVCRLRNSALSKAYTNLTIDADINCRLGTTCIYNFLNKSSFNIIINQGRTVKCIPITNPNLYPGTEGSVSLNGSTGGSKRRMDTYTINGTLECEYLVLKATTTNATDTFNVVVGGTGILKVNNQLIGNAGVTTTTTANLQLMDSATLILNGSQPTTGIDATGASNKFIIAPTATIAYSGDVQNIENGFGNYGNLLIGGTGNKSLTGNTSIASNLTILNGSTLDASSNNYNINIGGNWTDSNTTSGFLSENGSVNFNGASSQSINTNSQATFYNLTIVNGNSLTANNNLLVSNNLSLTSGILSLNNGSQVKVSNTASNAIFGGNANNYIDGKLVWSVAKGINNYNFPVGNGGIYANAAITSPSVATDIAVQYFNGSYTNTTSSLPFHVSTVEYWQIGSSINTASANVTLNYFNGKRSGIINPSNLVLAGFNVGNWNNLGQVSYTGNNDSGSVTGSTTNWGAFTFGSTSASNPLPVKLVSFNGNKNNQGVLLEWKTTSEKNTKLFVIESSLDGNQFNVLDNILAKDAAASFNYTYLDKTNYKVDNLYYRLKIVDDNGAFQFSNIIKIALNNTQYIQFKYYNNFIHLKLPENNTQNLATIFNAIGERVFQTKLIGNNTTITTNHLADGVYFLQVRSGNQLTSYQFKK